MTRKKDLGFLCLRMEGNTQGIGKMDSNMERANFLKEMQSSQPKGFGKRAN